MSDMRNILIATILTCITVFAHAATAKWAASASNINNGNGDASAKVVAGTSVFFFDAAYITQESLFNAFAANKSLDLTTVNGYAASSALSADGYMASSSVNFIYGEKSTEDQINRYSLFFAIVDNDKIFLSDDIDKAANQGDAAVSLTFGSQSDGSKVTTDGFVSVGQWSQVSGGDVPEPTTCSLLLVGLAGMGLKRLRKRGKKSA